MERQNSQPQADNDQPYYPIRRQLSSDTISLNQLGFSYKGGGDGFFLNDRDATDGDGTKTSFADLNRIRSNGDQGLCARCVRENGGGLYWHIKLDISMMVKILTVINLINYYCILNTI